MYRKPSVYIYCVDGSGEHNCTECCAQLPSVLYVGKISKQNQFLPAYYFYSVFIYPSVNFTLQMVQINLLTNVLPLQYVW